MEKVYEVLLQNGKTWRVKADRFEYDRRRVYFMRGERIMRSWALVNVKTWEEL